MILIKLIWTILLFYLSVILIGFLCFDVMCFIIICEEYFDAVDAVVNILCLDHNKIVKIIVKIILLLTGVLICPIMWLSLQKHFIQRFIENGKKAFEDSF